MRRKHFYLLLIAEVIISAVLFSGCKKEDNDNGKNLPVLLEGFYFGSFTSDIGNDSDSAYTIVTRIDNNTLKFEMNILGDVYCLKDITLQPDSNFGIYEYDSCALRRATGGGKFIGTNLDYLCGSSGGIGYNITFSGSK